jgi:hypothetical protein
MPAALVRSLLFVTVLSPLLLHAQATNEEKCDGSTVDLQGEKTAKEARAFLDELKDAVRANDKQKIAGMISYPVNFIHGGKRTHIYSKQTFLAHYDRIFDEHLRKTILDQSAHCLFGNANGEMIGSGQVWFSEMGDGSVKIITINPTAGM